MNSSIQDYKTGQAMTNAFLRKLCAYLLLTGLGLFLFSSSLFAVPVGSTGSLKLTWAASTSSGVAGYNVSYGTSSGNYTTTVNVGNVVTYTVTGLPTGTYYVAVQAYGTPSTLVSAYSTEASKVITSKITTDLTASKTSGVASLGVSFTPVTTGLVTSWAWSFPGSYTPTVTQTTGQVIAVSYPTAGTYSVSLTASAADGSTATQTYPAMITVTAPPPVANFTQMSTAGIAPSAIGFTDTSTSASAITGWSWNFGDGSALSTVQNPTHTYSVAGTYSVSLTATSAAGSNTITDTNLIAISAAPVAPPTKTVSSAAVTTLQGLVAAYGFEEVSGATVADSSGNGNLGTISNATRVTTGHSGKALSFNGTNAWVTINNSASLALTTGMTLEAWVYPTASMTGWRTVMMKEQIGEQVYTLYANSDSNMPVTTDFTDSKHHLIGGSVLSPNRWWHLVGTYDGVNQRLYVNGVQVAVQAMSGNILASTGALHIGGDSLWGEYFQGTIDEVRIYNRALTAAEVNYNLLTAVSVSKPAQFAMGDKTVESVVGYNLKGVAQAFQTVPKTSKQVTSVQVYLDAGTTATSLVAGIYADNNGHPGALVAQGTLTTLKSVGWNSVSIPVASVTAAKPYWVAILGANGQLVTRNLIGSGVGLLETSASSTLAALPSTWKGLTSTNKANSAMSAFGLGY